MDPALSYEVPDELRTLAKLVARAFYEPISVAVVDILVREKCVRASDLCGLFLLEEKHINPAINKLEEDKLVKSDDFEDILQHNADSVRQKKSRFYFIDYKNLVNTTRYRLHRMQKIVEDTVVKNTEAEIFVCRVCGMRFGNFDISDLLDMDTGVPMHCNTEIVEDQSQIAKSEEATGGLGKQLNEQLEPIFALLQKIEFVSIKDHVLRPPPTQRSLTNARDSTLDQSRHMFQRRNQIKQDDYFGNVQSKVVLEFTDEQAGVKKRDRMDWLVESSLADKAAAASMAGGAAASGADTSQPAAPTADRDAIAALLAAGAQQDEGAAAAAAAAAEGDDGEGEEESDDEMDDVEETVSCGGRQVPLLEVTAADKSAMTPEEKATYDVKYQEYYEREYG